MSCDFAPALRIAVTTFWTVAAQVVMLGTVDVRGAKLRIGIGSYHREVHS
jgi:hypothetical protein